MLARSQTIRITKRSGVTLIEVLVVITVIGILAALILPAIQFSRESARRSMCQSNLHQLGIAIQNHESDYGFIPVPHFYHSVLPYIDKVTFYQEQSQSGLISSGDFVVNLFVCPSDPLLTHPGSVNYVVNEGYGYQVYGSNGLRVPQGPRLVKTRWRDITDGLSMTACISEQLYRPDATEVTTSPTQSPNRFLWYTPKLEISPSQFDDFVMNCQQNRTSAYPILGNSFSLLNTEHGYDHNLPPNAVGCMNGDWTTASLYNPDYSIIPASSQHSGGVNMLLCDGSSRFLSSYVDLKVWRALGTRAGQEVVDNEP